jgi:hypothetical protein
LWDQGYFPVGAVAGATSRMFGGSATPTALKTRPTSPGNRGAQEELLSLL